MPGSASNPAHSPAVRLAYAGISVLLGLMGGLGNALVSANLSNIQGHLGLDPTQAAWLPASYLMVNMTANLLLVKFRQEFGLQRFAEIGLPLYTLLTILHLFVEDFPMAVLVRGASGFAGATVSTLALLYMLQAFPKAATAKGMILGLGMSQLATPVAWMLSPTLIDFGEWHMLYLFEAGLSLCALAAVVLLKLPPGVRVKAFEPLDFVTFLLMAPALCLLGAVLTQGRLQWWFEREWIAWALIGAIVLLTTAVLIESRRPNPLLQIGWLTQANTIRFALGAMTLRFLLSEQTYGATGLLQTLGMGPDQLRPLYSVLFVALLAGILVSAATFSAATRLPQILLPVVLIAIGSYIDLHATNETRPANMYLSQSMLSFASGMFMGPMMLIGITSALSNGPSYIISFSAMFGMTQSLGGLAGSAVLGTFQVLREKFHSVAVTSWLDPTNPDVAARLQSGDQSYASVLTDSTLRQAEGAASLAQVATREANVLAYNDVFLFTASLAMLFLGWSLFHTVRSMWRDRRPAATA